MLALTSAVFYGLGDFVGGFMTRRHPVWMVLAWSQLLGVVVLGVGLMIVPAERVTVADMLWGTLAGTVGIVGFAVLLSALAAGSMAIVAPVSGATAAAVPVIVDLAQGADLASREWFGVLLALTAVVLVGSDRGSRAVDLRIVGRAVLAGVAFGMTFVALGQTAPESALWPLVGARTATIVVSFAAALATRALVRPPVQVLGILGLMGFLDMTANVTVALALQRGPLGINSVLSSLYPAFTALAAIAILRERPSGQESAGIGLAMAAIVALAI